MTVKSEFKGGHCIRRLWQSCSVCLPSFWFPTHTEAAEPCHLHHPQTQRLGALCRKSFWTGLCVVFFLNIYVIYCICVKKNARKRVEIVNLNDKIFLTARGRLSGAHPRWKLFTSLPRVPHFLHICKLTWNISSFEQRWQRKQPEKIWWRENRAKLAPRRQISPLIKKKVCFVDFTYL